MKEISGFRGEYYYLSNFFPAVVPYNGFNWPTVENAFQAMKTLDEKERLEFLNLSPADAKKKGRSVKLRADWNEVKFQIMYEIVRAKFLAHPDLKAKLLATGDATIIEENDWGDIIWGVVAGVGNNHMGEILMRLRKEFREEETNNVR